MIAPTGPHGNSEVHLVIVLGCSEATPCPELLETFSKREAIRDHMVLSRDHQTVQSLTTSNTGRGSCYCVKSCMILSSNVLGTSYNSLVDLLHAGFCRQHSDRTPFLVALA